MLSKATLFTGLLWGYTAIEDEKLVEYRFGVILTVLMLTLIGSPLFSLVSYCITFSVYYISFRKHYIQTSNFLFFKLHCITFQVPLNNYLNRLNFKKFLSCR